MTLLVADPRGQSAGPHTTLPHVVVVGGGITGLACAYYLETLPPSGPRVNYSLLESGDSWGGKVVTETIDGFGDRPFVIEGGPDSFLTQKPWACQLAIEIGLGERIIGTNDTRRKIFVLRNGRPVPLPDGVLMIVPTRILPFALSPLISLPGKVRMGMDLFIPPKMDGKDETLAEFVTRRLGREAVDRLAEPLMSGIYNSEAGRQSLLATFPRFRALEEQHGSLVRGMLAGRRASRDPGRSGTNGIPNTVFASLQGGTAELVTALLGRLHGDLRLGIAATALGRDAGRYVVQLSDGQRVTADALILAVPSAVAAALIRPLAPQAATRLATIRYLSTGNVSLAYRLDEMSHPLNGFGIVVPRSERRNVNAITWSSVKFDFRAPGGFALLRAFFGGSRSPEMMAKPDDEVLDTVLREIGHMMGVSAHPLFTRLFRWFDANPQYDVGHLELLSEVEALLPPNLHLAGSAYRGVGLPDCVHQAEMTVRQVLEGAGFAAGDKP